MDLIIGAGITGLTYAARTSNDYIVVEKESEIGGYCRTHYSGDYVWDFSGHFFHFQHSEIRDYVMERLQKEEVLTVNKFTQIYYKGRLVDYPFQMNIHQLEKEEFIDCLYDLFAVKLDGNVSSFKEMLYAKFGKSIAEKFLIPYNEKLYATDLNNLDVDAMGRFFPYADKEQIILNFRNSKNLSYNSFFLYPKKGVIKVVESVASRVDANKIALNEQLISIDIEKKIAVTNKRTIHYDNLISTVPFPRLLDMAQVPYDRKVYSCNKVVVFNIGFDKKGADTKNNWIYFPDKDIVFYRVGFYDNIIGLDKMSLYVEVGFAHDEAVDEKQLYQRVLADLKKAGIVAEEQVVDYECVTMNPAYVHITRQSEADKTEKMEFLNSHGVYSIGRYGEWKYCSLEDNMHDAFMLAERLK
ncbi:MAG: FAD-dependent oxidoreductase [Bacteroidales bacterium]|nr:FAD-dependent oxidoreductase [Bacteroidales bacterium]